MLDSLAKDYSTGTIMHVRSVISEICKWCIANELLRYNPTEYLTIPKGKDKPTSEKDNVFTDEDIQKL